MKRIVYHAAFRLAVACVVGSVGLALLNRGFWLDYLPTLGAVATILLVAMRAAPTVANQPYFFSFSVARPKLTVFRVAFFAVLAYHAFAQIAHAPRYGAGDFNISHIAMFEALIPMPSRPGQLVLYLLESYLALCMVFGIAMRYSIRLLAALYAYTYFNSQLNSYQHHYLISLLLLICCFIPWESESPQRTAEAPGSAPETHVVSWALRLVLLQLAIVYFWAAIAKWESQWLSGDTLQRQLQVDWIIDLLTTVLGRADAGHPGGFAIVAKLVLFAELALAISLVIPKLWPIALFLGVSLHASIELANLEIGEFSYFMFALYLLLLPDKLFLRLAGWSDSVRKRLPRRARPEAHRRVVSVVLIIAATCSLMWLLPFAEGVFLVALMALWGLAAALFLRPGNHSVVSVAVAHLCACLVLVGFAQRTDVAFEYHKFWAGAARRAGDSETMREVYPSLKRLRPSYGSSYYYLGTLHEQDGNTDKALAEYELGQRHAPSYFRSFSQAAQLHQRAGNVDLALATYRRQQVATPDEYRGFLGEALLQHALQHPKEALAAARRALELAPSNKQAAELVRRYARSSPRN